MNENALEAGKLAVELLACAVALFGALVFVVLGPRAKQDE